jgi:hypothetical protein
MPCGPRRFWGFPDEPRHLGVTLPRKPEQHRDDRSLHWPVPSSSSSPPSRIWRHRGSAFARSPRRLTPRPRGDRLICHIFASLAEFERSVIRERTKAGLRAAHARGRLGGRPPALSREDLEAAEALLRDSAITVEQVAKRLGVAPSTLYRHLPGGHSAVEPRSR